MREYDIRRRRGSSTALLKMRVNNIVSSCRLLVICLTAVHTISGQCISTSCTSSCTEECYPDVWERDLCVFYRQVSSWRASAEKCGLILPDSPDRSAQLQPQVKWNQARMYWEELMYAWQQAALTNGVLNQREEDSSWTSPSLTMDLGSGDDISSTTQSLFPLTSEPPTSPVVTSQSSEWLDSTLSWESHFSQWESFVESQSGLQLPDSSASDIIARLSNSTEASAVRANSAEWLSLSNNWHEVYDTYAGMFSGLCPML